MGLYEEIGEVLRYYRYGSVNYAPHDLSEFLIENVPKLDGPQREDYFEEIGREAEFMSSSEKAIRRNLIYCLEQLMPHMGNMSKSRSARRAMKIYMQEKAYKDGDFWAMDFSQRVISKWIELSSPEECSSIVSGMPDTIFNIMKENIEQRIKGSSSACYFAGKNWDRYKFEALQQTILPALDDVCLEKAYYNWPKERYDLITQP
jgi:hypothetical protein